LQGIALKSPSRLVLGISGDGPLSQVMAEVAESGDLRGMVSAPQIELPTAGKDELGDARAMGNGLMQVWKEEERHSHRSQVSIDGGRIGDALTHHLEQSEQTRSAVLLGVLAERNGIAAAGGLMLEMLPGPEDETALDQLEKRLTELPGASFLLATGGLDGLIEEVLGPSGASVSSSKKFRYHCRCTDNTVRRYLRGLAAEETEGLRTEAGELEAECVFCGRRYRFDDSDLHVDERL
jgi:molecular chaperone Hsp33